MDIIMKRIIDVTHRIPQFYPCGACQPKTVKTFPPFSLFLHTHLPLTL